MFKPYNILLQEAFERSKEFGISPDSKNYFNPHHKKEQINEETLIKIKNKINTCLKPLSESSKQCILFNFNSFGFIYDIITKENKIELNYNLTIGNIYNNNKKLFGSGIDSFIKKIRKPNENINKENLHCWISFSSGEILDLTILSTQEIKNGDILFGMPDEFGKLGEFSYYPVFLGCDYLAKTRIVSEITNS